MAVSYWPEKFAKMVNSNLQTQKYLLPLPNGFDFRLSNQPNTFFASKLRASETIWCREAFGFSHHHLQQAFVEVPAGSRLRQEGSNLVDDQQILFLEVPDSIPGFRAYINLLGNIMIEFLAEWFAPEGFAFPGR